MRCLSSGCTVEVAAIRQQVDVFDGCSEPLVMGGIRCVHGEKDSLFGVIKTSSFKRKFDGLRWRKAPLNNALASR